MENLQEITTNYFLTFKLEEESFGVNVSKVLEILEVGHITKVPHAPEYMRGVVNLRGNVLPVIDSRVKFGMTSQSFTVDTCIIVLSIQVDDTESIKVGALVDAVQEVMEINETEINPMPTVGTRYRAEFIRGMVNQEEDFLMVLDVDRVFTSEELNLVLESSPDHHPSETI
ncbi:chemotaxis protein CheW [Catalinimonas niigatensis]|uniref:chemotaxis protein CheW n=1 Tax=Catalinimonas niigatensis TaxID=1397264 RepID=UPI002665658B|nr:chemotaxis protein CheW [Catalinimonas niigatensis]WPP53535.1 chemotaxis protein CheW [Catalinimonas niigatensis]